MSAIVRADGDALVMHVGERPYVVAGTNTINISTHPLTLEMMTGMLAQLLPQEGQSSLEELGAVEHRLPDLSTDRFNCVAARGGDDIWIEIRRRRNKSEAAVAAEAQRRAAEAIAEEARRVETEAAAAQAAREAAEALAEEGRRAAEAARAAAEAAAAEEARRAAEAAAEEERRLAAEAAAAAEAARLAAEAVAEEARRAAEAEAEAAAAEERRRAEEAAAAEAARVAAEAAAAEDARRAAEAAAEAERVRVAEAARLAAEAAAAEAAAAEAAAAEAAAAEAARVAAEELRRVAEAAAEAERVRAAEAAAAEAARVAAEAAAAEAARVAAEEARRVAEAAAEAERVRAAEAAAAEAARAAAEAKAEEERRLAAEWAAAEAAAADEARRIAAAEAAEEVAAAEAALRAAAAAEAAAEEARRVAAAAEAAAEEARRVAAAQAAAEEASRAAAAAAADEARRVAAAEDARRIAAAEAAADEARRLAAAAEERRRSEEAAAAERERRLAAESAALRAALEAQAANTPPEAPAAPQPTPVPEIAAAVPLTRTVRIEVPPRATTPARPFDLERLLNVAGSTGASALFLTTDARPHVRVSGDIRQLENEPLLSRADVEAAIAGIAPEGATESGLAAAEWLREHPALGGLRCSTFTDHRGPGLMLRMIAMPAATAEQLGLSPAVQMLAGEPEGLVLVAGARGSGKSTMVSALVDLVNRHRAEFVITLERQIRLVHEHQSALVSQREIRGGADEAVAAARAALREAPDVLVIDDLIAPQLVPLVLTAAAEGVLVFVSMTAASTSDAVQNFIELAPAEMRTSVNKAMAETFRGAVAQTLLKKSGGGLAAAREVLLATLPVARAIGDGQLAQLPLAIESGRKHGMISFSESMTELARAGSIDIREAFRKAPDRDGLLNGLKREGVDTSLVEWQA